MGFQIMFHFPDALLVLKLYFQRVVLLLQKTLALLLPVDKKLPVKGKKHGHIIKDHQN